MNAGELTREISSLLQGSDHSLTPRLRRLYSEYQALATELCSQIDECKKLEQRLSRNEAMRHAGSFEPPLAQRAQLLDFAEREQFVALCATYELSLPQIDFDYVNALSAPLCTTEKQVGALMQEWRKTARTGSSSQRMELLRKIVHGLGERNKDAWMRNLMETERQRYAEIAQELDSQEWHQEDQARLEAINLELQSPLLVTPPSAELLQRLQEYLLPLQKQSLAAQMEVRLEDMNACYAARNDSALEESYQKWLNLVSHPLAEVTAVQQQFVNDVKNYLENQRQEREKHAQYDELLAELKDAMDKNRPYLTLVRLYNKLTLLDLPLPSTLKDDLERLGAEYQANERRLNIRRIAYGILIALVAVTLIFVAIYYIQLKNSISTSMETMRSCIASGDYQEALDYYDSLKAKAPQVAEDARLLALQADAQANLQRREKELQAARQEFTALANELERKLTGDFRQKMQIEKIQSRLEELRDMLDEEGKERLIALQQQTRTRLAQMTQELEKDFYEQRDKLFNEMAEMIAGMNEKTDLVALENRLTDIKRIVNDMKTASVIDSGVREVMSKLWEEKLESLTYALKAEKERRKFFHDLWSVANFQDYASALQLLQQEYPSKTAEYAQAIGAIPEWKDIILDLDKIQNMLEIGKPFSMPVSHLGRDFQTYVSGSKAPQNDWQGFFTQIMTDCKYYEVIAADDKGRQYFFYAKTEPVLERDKRNRRLLRYVALDIDECIHPFDRSYTFRLEELENGKSVYRDMAAGRHHEVMLPEYFVSLEPAQLCELFQFAQKYQDKTEMNEEELMSNLLRDLSTLKNPLVKGALLRRLLAQLAHTATLCDVDITMKIKQLQDCKLRTEYWKVPDAPIKYAQEIKAFETFLQNLDLKHIMSARDFRWGFLTALYRRRLVPAAVVFIQPDGKVSLTSFLKLPAPEYYVFKDDKMHIIASDLKQGAITAEKDAELLFNGQLLWSFSDGRTSEDFLTEWEQKSVKAKIPIRVTPAACPSSLFYLLQPQADEDSRN